MKTNKVLHWCLITPALMLYSTHVVTGDETDISMDVKANAQVLTVTAHTKKITVLLLRQSMTQEGQSGTCMLSERQLIALLKTDYITMEAAVVDGTPTEVALLLGGSTSSDILSYAKKEKLGTIRCSGSGRVRTIPHIGGGNVS